MEKSIKEKMVEVLEGLQVKLNAIINPIDETPKADVVDADVKLAEDKVDEDSAADVKLAEEKTILEHLIGLTETVAELAEKVEASEAKDVVLVDETKDETSTDEPKEDEKLSEAEIKLAEELKSVTDANEILTKELEESKVNLSAAEVKLSEVTSTPTLNGDVKVELSDASSYSAKMKVHYANLSKK